MQITIGDITLNIKQLHFLHFVQSAIQIEAVNVSGAKCILFSNIYWKEIVDKHGSVHEIEKRKITRKNYIIKTVIVLAAIICLVIIMSQGTWYIQPYIATIPSVEHRNLQVSYNKNSGVYSIKNEEN